MPSVAKSAVLESSVALALSLDLFLFFGHLVKAKTTYFASTEKRLASVRAKALTLTTAHAP